MKKTTRTKQRGRLADSLKEHQKAAYLTAILDAATFVLTRDGFHSAKMVDIAMEAGIAVGTLYNYFPGKSEVLKAVQARQGKRYIKAVQDAIVKARSPQERLAAVVQATLGFAEAHGGTSGVILDLGAQARDPELESWLGALLMAVFDELRRADMLREDIDDQFLLPLFGGLLRGTIAAWLDSDRSFKLEARAADVLSVFLHGACPR